MNKKTINLIAILCFGILAFGQLSPDQVARLGKDLTPLGGEKAGNKDGTIPAWDGGITKPPAGYVKGSHHVDPYADDAILFTITGNNVDQYKEKVPAGLVALLKTYPTFKMNVYPTHRSASVPQRIYDATKAAAAKAKLAEGGNGVLDCIAGIPFPIPTNGHHLIWNHLLRYRGEHAQRKIGQAAPTRKGKYTMVEFEDEFYNLYHAPNMTYDKLENKIILFKQKVVAPARLAGGILLAHETMNQVEEPRKAWLYNPGQRRVRRAPNVAYDNPGTASDGLRTSDQFDMFNGAPDRYNWKLVGKKEMYVPYNSYKLHSNKLKYSDILTPLHINQDLARYELHRVWILEATLKNDARHLYKRRTFYIDEDSWQILVVDQYDNRDQLWRVSEGHAINYYDCPTFWTTLEVHTDLQSGRYLAIGLDNEQDKMYEFSKDKGNVEDFTPAALRRSGRR